MMGMKHKLIVLIVLLFAAFGGYAQQKPHYSQYQQNMSVINPAVTGMYNGIDIRMGIRNQWQKVESAPKTAYLTMSMPISFGGDMATYTTSDLGVNDPETKDEMFDYQSSLSHHAIGAVFLSDKTGPLTRITANFTYAYHLSIANVFNLAVGFGAGVNRLGLDNSTLKFEEPDDPVVGTSEQINKYTPDLNAGIYLYGSSYYFGASMQQIIKNKLAFDGNYTEGKDAAHYFITTGYRFWINTNFSVLPSVMLKYVNPLPKAFDVNLKVGYKNLVWLAAGYRKNDAFTGSFGFDVLNKVSVGYTYDYTTSEIKSITSGSHEITARIRL